MNQTTAGPHWSESPFKRAQISAIAAIGVPTIAALGSSLSWKVEGLDRLHFDGAGSRPIMAFFHGRVLAATYFFRHRGINVMISENFDGEWIARIIERFGFTTSRGSTTRGGQRALLRMSRALERGHPAGFAVDGPRGPARVVQPGALWLAKLSGHPVVPFHMEASRYWSLPSWDRTQVPKPFSTVAVVVGEPVLVMRDADTDELERCRQQVESSLHALERRAVEVLSWP